MLCQIIVLRKVSRNNIHQCMITCRGADLSQDPVILTPLSLLGGPVIGLLPTYSQVLFNLREFDISFAGFGGEKR